MVVMLVLVLVLVVVVSLLLVFLLFAVIDGGAVVCVGVLGTRVCARGTRSPAFFPPGMNIEASGDASFFFFFFLITQVGQDSAALLTADERKTVRQRLNAFQDANPQVHTGRLLHANPQGTRRTCVSCK